jgi:hypothetical protein
MQLLILIIIFLWLGYALAHSRAGKKIDRAVENSLAWVEHWFQRLRRGQVDHPAKVTASPQTFQQWVNSPASQAIPEDVRKWMKSLDTRDFARFEKGLKSRLASLGCDLEQVIQPGQEHKPGVMQIFVEAVVVYSREYQNAVRSKPKKKTPDKEEKAGESDKQEEMAAAQKQPSRRKNASPPTAASAHPAGGD